MDLIEDYPCEFNTDNNDALYEELYVLREKVFTLEKDNLELKNALMNMKTLKEQLETNVFNNTQQKKARKNTQKSITQVQLLNFYCKNKDNPSIVNKLKTDLMSIGYDGTIPWQLVKKECLRRFALLTEQEKMEYIKI